MSKQNQLTPYSTSGSVAKVYSFDDAQKLDYEFFNNFTSIHTKKSYKNDIKQFISFIKINFAGTVFKIINVERFHIVAYRNYLTDKSFAPKTINRKLSSVSSYFDFLAEKGFIKFNPATSVKRPRQEVLTETNDLSDDDVIKLFEAVNEKGTPLHRAVIYLLFSTGIRKSELIGLKRKDFFVANSHCVISIKAKGGKYLLKVIHPICEEIIQVYMEHMKSIDRLIEPEHNLFQPSKNPSKENANLQKPLRPKAIDYMVEKYTKLAGITTKISPHSARATYIGSALEAGEELLKVSQDVGHASVKTTQEYNKRRMRLKDSPSHNLGYLKKVS